MNTLKEIDDFTREKMQKLLGQCTEKQQDLFSRMYPSGIAQMPVDKISWAIKQLERTIAKNANAVSR